MIRSYFRHGKGALAVLKGDTYHVTAFGRPLGTVDREETPRGKRRFRARHPDGHSIDLYDQLKLAVWCLMREVKP